MNGMLIPLKKIAAKGITKPVRAGQVFWRVTCWRRPENSQLQAEGVVMVRAGKTATVGVEFRTR